MLQVAFGSGFKCNSAVWIALNPAKTNKEIKTDKEQAIAATKLVLRKGRQGIQAVRDTSIRKQAPVGAAAQDTSQSSKESDARSEESDARSEDGSVHDPLDQRTGGGIQAPQGARIRQTERRVKFESEASQGSEPEIK